MSDVKALREALAKIDEHRRFADEVEHARGKIRLGQKPVVRQGVLRFLRREVPLQDLIFTRAETDAIYAALGRVRDDERRAARKLEESIAIEPLNRRTT